MTDRPILFSGPMVNAILEGRKTQTRRVLKPSRGYQSTWLSSELLNKSPTCYLATVDGRLGVQMQHPKAGKTCDGVYVDSMSPLCWVPIPYQVGDRIYVREAWKTAACWDDVAPRNLAPKTLVKFNADGFETDANAFSWDAENQVKNPVSYGKFRQGIHMPRKFSRLTLVVEDVIVQRVQEISALDARAEGVNHRSPKVRQMSLFGASKPERERIYTRACKWEFEDLWDSINDARGFGWDANPWVVAVTFETHKCNIDQMGTT